MGALMGSKGPEKAGQSESKDDAGAGKCAGRRGPGGTKGWSAGKPREEEAEVWVHDQGHS